jgi:osmoprotectant transport system substrate-binding protein
MAYRLKAVRGLIGLLRRVLILAIAMVVLAGCRGHRGIVVGSKNFPEQLVLGEILAQHIEKKLGIPVERQFNLAGSYISHQVLLEDRIDVYPEYTGTALAILEERLSSSSDEVYQRVKDEYHRRFGIEATPRLGFNNSFVLVVRKDDAQQHNLRTISDLARYAQQWRIAVGYEFLQRPDGFAGLAKTYNLHFAEPPQSMDLGLLYRSLDNRQVVIVGSSTDGSIEAHGFVTLEDDKHYFPPYDAIFLVREKTLGHYPALREALADLSGKISERDIRQINIEIERDHRDLNQLATEFLREKGL